MSDPYLDGIMRKVMATDREVVVDDATEHKRLQTRLQHARIRLEEAHGELEAAQGEHIDAGAALDKFEGR